MEASKREAIQRVQAAYRGLPKEEEENGEALVSNGGDWLIRALRNPIMAVPRPLGHLSSYFPSWLRPATVGWFWYIS